MKEVEQHAGTYKEAMKALSTAGDKLVNPYFTRSVTRKTNFYDYFLVAIAIAQKK